MRKKIQQGKRQISKLRMKVVLVCGLVSGFLILAGTILVLLNMNSLKKIQATETGFEGGGNDVTNGEIISEFTWEKDPVSNAILGPDAFKSGKEAHSMDGGKGSTKGLSAGANGKNIDLEISGEEIFKQDGIDISLDFKRSEASGDFFSRGNVFNFGMENGYLAINYSVENSMGKKIMVKEKTNYEIPTDPIFRNYKFTYTPSVGKGEIFVNGIIVWQKETDRNSALSWKNAGNIIIGRNMNGGGEDHAIMDNLVIRSCGAATPLAESLLNFMLEAKEGGVKIHWSTSVNENVDYFTLERSLNGSDFVKVVNIYSRKDSADEEYTYTDKTNATTPLVYYRLKQTFKNGKFISHSLSAIKFKSEKGLSIERVSPSPFGNSCDISYFLPKTGRVWILLTDDNGNLLNTESYEAPQGKNVHVFKDNGKIQPGTYCFTLIFDNQKVSKRITRI